MTDLGKHWVVVANESRAVVFSRTDPRSPLNERLIIENAIAREKIGDILADKGGRSFDSLGRGRHTMAKEETGPKRQEASRFARKIVAVLDKAMQRGDCRDFGLIAAPEFLGLMRRAMAVAGHVQPDFEIDKNIATFDPEEIEALVEREL